MFADQTMFMTGTITPRPWQEFVDEFMLGYSPSQRAKTTRRMVSDVIRDVTALGVQSTTDLTVATVNRYLASMSPNLSPNTVRGRLRYLQVVCTYAFRCGYVRISPFLIKPLRQWVRPAPPRGKKFHDPHDIAKVLDTLRAEAGAQTGWQQWKARRTLALTATLAYTGLRAAEAYFLELADIDLTRRLLHVRHKTEHRLKTTASERTVIIPPPLVPILTDWLSHRMDRPPGFTVDEACSYVFPCTKRTGPWTSGSPGGKPRDCLVAAGVRAGVTGFNPLSLRHTCATTLMYAGATETVIMQQLGHTNLTTQNHYKHRNEEALRSIVDKLVY